jgi:hypothetical protein
MPTEFWKKLMDSLDFAAKSFEYAADAATFATD